MCIRDSIEAARDIRAAHPETGVVVLSQHADESYALALFSDGSAGLGYLLKDRIGDLEDLVHALREVCAGGSVIDPQIVDTLVRRRSASAASPLAALSPRELEVLREMAAGKTNAGIEQALFLSSSTVEKHVNAIFTKLRLPETGVHRRVGDHRRFDRRYQRRHALGAGGGGRRRDIRRGDGGVPLARGVPRGAGSGAVRREPVARRGVARGP